MKVRPEHSGTCVVTRSGSVVRLLGVYPDALNPSISYESSDGHSEIITSDMWRSLDDQTEDWRPATEEETADFQRRFTPPPQNWF